MKVRETLTYVRESLDGIFTLKACADLRQAAKLRLPTSLSDETVTLIVDQTIDELGLRDAAETVVGGPLRKGISGGEKRCEALEGDP